MMNKYKVKVLKTTVREFFVDICANSEEDIRRIEAGSIEYMDDAVYNDEDFEYSIYNWELCDIADWDWQLDAYNDSIVDETYELGTIELID